MKEDGEDPREGIATPASRLSRSALLRGYFFFGGVLLVVAVFFYANTLIRGLNEQASLLSSLFARFLAVASVPAAENESSSIRIIFRETIQSLNFPVVITDTEGRPRAWKGIGIDPTKVPDELLESADPKHPTGVIKQVLDEVARMDAKNHPVPMVRPGTEVPLGYVHYGESGIVRGLKWIPWLELFAFFAFLGLGLMGFRSVKVSEQRSIWVGLAKETAHQLATPISSILGWVEVLKESAARTPDGTAILDEKIYIESIAEIQNDADRLQRVASRFSHVGSTPRLQLADVAPIVSEAVDYWKRRLPRLGRGLVIEERYEEVPPVNLDPELLGWVVENVLKNAIDATDGDRGPIRVSVARRPETESVEITIQDRGRGIAPEDRKKVFDPGFTTKRRGWGLGLTLARRIVEEYHGGKIFLRESRVGEGSTFVVSFPT